MFTKHLQVYPVEQAADVAKSLGLDGLDLTVRPGGHVEPADAENLLPGVFEAVKSRGLSIPLITTGITSAETLHSESIFRLAAEGGTRYLKLGYWRYEGFGNMVRQLDEVKARLDGIEKLAQRYGVTAVIHTHSSAFMTASGAIVAELLRDRDPDALGAYPDAGHLTAEGGDAVWKMSLDLLAPWIKVVAVKDMMWISHPDAELGKLRWRTMICPFNMGFVRWPEVFDCLRQSGFDGVVSVHSEYQGSHSWRDLNTEQLIQQTRADLEYLWDAIGGK